jgi:hypothetical protein
VEFLAFVGLIVGISLKQSRTQEWFFRNHVQEITNITIGSFLWAGLVVGEIIYIRRIIMATKSGKRWSMRRKRVTQKCMVEHTIVLINITSWLIQNIYVLSRRCSWFDGYVVVNGVIQWSCWNAIFALFLMYAHDATPWVRCTRMKGFRPDAIIMDAPRSYHLSKGMAFLFVEGLLIATGVLGYNGDANVPEAKRVGGCSRLDFECNISTAVTVLVTLVVVCFIGYFVGVIYCFHTAYAMLREKEYNSMRMANMNVRLQARLRGLGMGFFILCVILNIYVDYGSCISYLQSWLGFLPMNIVMAGLVVISSYLSMPNNPKTDNGIMTVWLQEFAWSERELPGRREERRSGLCGPAENCPMDTEPMFCFETSLKMLYWSMLVYRYEEADGRGVTLEGAMALYNLENFELMWERKLDTKALMAWNEDTVVLSFRGTASFRNVLADIKAWYAVHPPARGQWWATTRPFVHQGFLRSWQASGFQKKVIDRISEIILSLKDKNKNVRVFVTGHSLGGALATLAAHDIATAVKCLPKMNLTVYTFGAPRVGNHAFAREVSERVPQLWNVINDQDTVPRSGKFLFMYKRPGQRVLINSDGDMIVRPSFVEASVQRRATSSVAHHLLVNYQRAHIAIIKAQFTSKRLRDGMEGVLAVAEACGMQNLLKAAGVEYQDLRKLRRLTSSGTALLAGLSGSGKKHMRKLSSHAFSLNFDVKEVAAAITQGESDEDEEEDISSRGGTLSDEQKAAPKPAPVRDIRKGVHELEGAADNVHYAAAIAALSDGVRERPSESEADATMATGGDLDVNDGHHSHLQSQPAAGGDTHTPAADRPADGRHAAGGHAPAGAHVIDMLHAVSPFAAHHRQSTAAQPGSPSSPASDAARSGPLRSGSVMSEGSSDGEMPDADAPVHNYAGKMEGGRCRYTQLNGVSCKHRIADAQRRKHQAGGFCLLKDRPKEPDVVEGADQGRFSRIIDGPMCMKTKTQAFLTDSVNRMLGH